MKDRSLVCIFVIAVIICLSPATVLSAKAALNDNALPLKGKTISIMGDSISTYAGWSDVDPIIDSPGTETCGRTGEAYYGPTGGDFHNTDILVDDTWWHQAATQLGAEVLVSNASNSTGLLCASYPSIPAWEDYLKARLMYKSRPYYLGKDGKNPDIIALYVGSNEVARAKANQFGSVEDINFDTLIVENADGTYTYTEPTTVAEAYCILLHKISVTYPNAEIYCFKVVPSAGGNLSTCNGKGRLPSAKLFNDMVDGVAEHYDAIVVDLMSAFELDPDDDGVATQEAFDTFKTYYHEDPHPNANGFDVITECFVDAVLNNSKYIAEIETEADSNEFVGLDIAEGDNEITRTTKDFLTGNGLLVNYNSLLKLSGEESTFEEKYTSKNQEGTYFAEGGLERTIKQFFNGTMIDVPILLTEPENPEDSVNVIKGREEGLIDSAGEKDTDGVYDYTTSSVHRQGKVTIKAEKLKVNERTSRANFVNTHYIKSDIEPSEENNLLSWKARKKITSPGPIDIPKDYDFRYLGSDTCSEFFSAHAHTEKHPDFPDEPAAYTDSKRTLYVHHSPHSAFASRGLVVPKMYFKDGTVEATEESGMFLARWDAVQQFVLSDAEGNLVTGYCADKDTGAAAGYNYKLSNLEDATYYSNDEARMIRTIAQNGYWGTESGFGSLDAVKNMMKNAPEGTFTEDDINKLTDGMALTATQYAIWTYSNVMSKIEFLNCYYGSSPSAVKSSEKPDQADVEIIFKLYHYLTSLEPAPDLEIKTTEKVLLNENNFLETVSLNIKSKPEDHANNQDSDSTNDVYMTDISFKIGVAPDTDDDLVVQISRDGEAIATGRLTGEVNPNARTTEIPLTPDESGVYTFTDILVQEGTDAFNFYLSGEQDLKEAAQLLLSEVKNGEASQPMVVVVSGTRDVRASLNLQFTLNVDEELVVTEHVWRTEETIVPVEPASEPAEDAHDTGDDINLLLLLAILVTSATVFVITLFINRFEAR